jgi:hypothetical protein
MNWKRFDIGIGFIFCSILATVFGLDNRFSGRLFESIVFMVVGCLFSAAVVYPIKTRRAAKRQKIVDDQKRAAEAASKPSFAATRKGIRKS